MNKRRIFTSDFKQKIVGELNIKSPAQLSREYDLSPSVINRWKRELTQYGADAFRGNGATYKFEAIVAEKDRLIGQLYAENDLLKKNIAAKELREKEERILRHIK